MLTPMSAQWLAGRVTPTQDRDAQQLADVRALLERKVEPSVIDRLQAILGRAQPSPRADCCAA